MKNIYFFYVKQLDEKQNSAEIQQILHIVKKQHFDENQRFEEKLHCDKKHLI